MVRGDVCDGVTAGFLVEYTEEVHGSSIGCPGPGSYSALTAFVGVSDLISEARGSGS
jgi:hypothetical protein